MSFATQNLPQLVPYPNTPWHFSQSLQERVSNTENANTLSFKKCIVLPSDPEWDFVLQLFLLQKPAKRGIKRIYAISVQQFLNSERRGKSLFFQAERWEHLEESNNAAPLPHWHECQEEKIRSICQYGFDILRRKETDPGLIENGIYSTTNESKGGNILLSWASIPTFWIELQPDLPFSPTTIPETVGDLLSVVMNALRHESLQQDDDLKKALKKEAEALLVFGDRASLTINNKTLFTKLADIFQTKEEVDQLARKNLIGDPAVANERDQNPFGLIQKQISQGKFDLAWSNLLIKLPNFFDTKKLVNFATLYSILAKLLPHLTLNAKEDLLNKIVYPLEILGFFRKEGFQLLLAIAPWLVNECKKGGEKEQWHETVYKPAFELYGNALQLSKTLYNQVLYYRKASDLLSNLLYEQLPTIGSAIDKALDNGIHQPLEFFLPQLALIRNTFCLTEDEQSRLIQYYEKMVPFFGQHGLTDQNLEKLLEEGQDTNQNKFPEPYVQRCDQALNDWKSTFSSQELFTLFPSLFEKLYPTDGRTKGCELLLALLGNPQDLSPPPRRTLIKRWLQKGHNTSLVLFAVETAATSETEKEVEYYLPMIEGAVAHLLEKNSGVDEHERLYTLLNGKTILEPLKERYISALPEGPLFDRLASIPHSDAAAPFIQEEFFTTDADGELTIRCDFTSFQLDGMPDLVRQRIILRKLQSWPTHSDKKPKAISLIGCTLLTSNELLPFLHHDLVSLDLRGSSIGSIPPALDDCPIEKLYLSGCEKLTCFTQKFPHLEILHIDSCKELTWVKLEACNLQTLKMGNNPKLSNVFVRGNIFTEINMEGSPHINLEQIYRDNYPAHHEGIELSPPFSARLGGYIDYALREKDPSQKQLRLGMGLLSPLKRNLQGGDFEPYSPTDALTMEGFNINFYEVLALAQVLPFTHFTSLNLRNDSSRENQIGGEGINALANLKNKDNQPIEILI